MPGPKDPTVDVVEKTTPFKGYFQVDQYRLRHRTYEGGFTGIMQREVFERGHAAAVVLYDADLDQLVMIEQFRVGAHAAGWHPWMWEIVAGIIEDGETAEEVIRREVVEEANCPVQALEPLISFLVTPGGSSESIALFCGQVDSATVGGVHGLAEEHEDIRVTAIGVEDVFTMLDAGEIINATALIGILLFRARHAEFREKWRRQP
ncbi:MAG: NUDIX domain-containing protein [Magnetospiraceae bacterium]